MKTALYRVILFLMVVTAAGCQRSCASLDRSLQASDRTYHVESYSGGKLIAVYDFTGILNNQDASDGYYFYKGDTLIEVGGDIIVTSY